MDSQTASHVVLSVEGFIGLLASLGTGTITIIMSILMKRVGEVRTQLNRLNETLQDFGGKLVRLEEWRDNHMREMDRRLMMLEHRIESCQYAAACPAKDARQRGD